VQQELLNQCICDLQVHDTNERNTHNLFSSSLGAAERAIGRVKSRQIIRESLSSRFLSDDLVVHCILELFSIAAERVRIDGLSSISCHNGAPLTFLGFEALRLAAARKRRRGLSSPARGDTLPLPLILFSAFLCRAYSFPQQVSLIYPCGFQTAAATRLAAS